MKVKQYQQIHRLQASHKENFDKVAHSVAYYFGLTTEQVDNLPPKKFVKLVKKFTKRFEVKKPFWVYNMFNTDARKLTFGQFLELQEWLKKGEVDSLHLVAATILKVRKDHRMQSDMILDVPANRVVFFVAQFLNSYEKLISDFPYLFKKNGGEEDKEAHPFLRTFGWMFSAKSIADYTGLKINEVYEMPIIEAFNILQYCKGYSEYQEFLSK